MIFEATITTTTVDDKGNDKALKRNFVLENYDTFGEVEKKLYEEFGNENGFEVCAIKISKLKEVANEKPSGDTESKIFIMTICDTFVLDDGDEKTMKYTVAFFAKDMREAHQFAQQYIIQGLDDMELKGIKESKFEEVIR